MTKLNLPCLNGAPWPRTPGNWPERTCATSTPPIRSAGRISTSSTMRGCGYFAATDHARDLSGAHGPRAAVDLKGACSHVPRRSDQHHRAAAALHTALRSEFAGRLPCSRGARVARQAGRIRRAVRAGAKRGVTGKKFRQIVNIGIGGSDLGRCWSAMRSRRNGAATSRRTSCRTWTAPSSRT